MNYLSKLRFFKEFVIVTFVLVSLKLYFATFGNELKSGKVLSRQLQSNVDKGKELQSIDFHAGINFDQRYQDLQTVLKEDFTKPYQERDNPIVQNLLNGKEAVPLSPAENELLFRAPIDLALIFTNAVKNSALQYNLKRAVYSLFKYTSTPIRLHLISDEESFSLGSAIIKDISESKQLQTRHVKLVFVSAVDLANEVELTVKILQEYFTNKTYSKYRDFLFFFSLFLHHLLPGLNNIILMDIDIEVRGDLAELYSHFSRFSDAQVIGLGPELSPVYRHILSSYRSRHLNTSLGSPLSTGGFPGYNSGVLLINIPRLRNSSVIRSYLTKERLDAKTTEYSFRGHLGDQDLYTLIALDYPEIFYALPCNWNRQLCKWWNNKLYEKVFDEYFECKGDVKILHGNCKTQIPEDVHR